LFEGRDRKTDELKRIATRVVMKIASGLQQIFLLIRMDEEKHLSLH
jgi:hypothetical protein